MDPLGRKLVHVKFPIYLRPVLPAVIGFMCLQFLIHVHTKKIVDIGRGLP